MLSIRRSPTFLEDFPREKTSISATSSPKRGIKTPEESFITRQIIDWSIKVYTDKKEASSLETSDPSVYISLIDSDQLETEKVWLCQNHDNIILDHRGNVALNRSACETLFLDGQVDEFSFRVFSSSKPIKRLRIGTDSLSKWILDKVEVINENTSDRYLFICHQSFLKNEQNERCEMIFYAEEEEEDENENEKSSLADKHAYKDQTKDEEESDVENSEGKQSDAGYANVSVKSLFGHDEVNEINLENKFTSQEANSDYEGSSQIMENGTEKKEIILGNNEGDASENDSMKTFGDNEYTLDTTENENEHGELNVERQALSTRQRKLVRQTHFVESEEEKVASDEDLTRSVDYVDTKTKSVSFLDKEDEI